MYTTSNIAQCLANNVIVPNKLETYLPLSPVFQYNLKFILIMLQLYVQYTCKKKGYKHYGKYKFKKDDKMKYYIKN